MPLIDDVDGLQSIFVNRATGNGNDDDERDYPLYRQSVLNDPAAAALVPAWVKRIRNLDQFWGFIQPKFPSYAERRKFIWEEFSKLVEYAESGGSLPADSVVSEALSRFDAEHVRIAWSKALERRAVDPEGAITMARTLLESTCKHILDEAGESDHETTPDLNRLYKQTATLLNLTKAQHEEVVFKQILGGCTAVVEGLGSLRNKLSDAHGKGKAGAKAAPRHAELAVNLAGSTALFLLATWEARNT
ncbi:abortive infection family protein [Pseudomonas rhodesiae]|uniref:abortive infection family protein n=1 Tax=Pseudomonas rhodesiae TaxID=76760 RepID=UPI0028AB71F0|nr:abortive infection family protein [Pseudomonas rhodesiae]